MDFKSKIDIAARLKSGERIVVDLGCGAKKLAGSIGIDRSQLPDVDIITDIEKGLGFLPDSSVDELHCRSVLEHLENFEPVMSDIVRVLKPTGTAHIFVPHFSNPYFYSDYTHKRPFGLYTFYYFVDEPYQLKRKVPVFYTNTRIKILSLRLVFRSPFWLGRQLRKMFGFFVNLSSGCREFYEQYLCYVVPCHGIEIVFTPDRQNNSQQQST
ncbi:MAG: methyltransferase domain-containing protein [Phycisphaerae bacterium]